MDDDESLSSRAHKDPKLQPNEFFWDLRQDSLPFFRALQFTSHLIQVRDTTITINNNNNKQELTGSIKEITKIPTKYDIQQEVLLTQEGKVSNNNNLNNNIDDNDNVDRSIIILKNNGNDDNSRSARNIRDINELVSFQNDKVYLSHDLAVKLYGMQQDQQQKNNNNNDNDTSLCTKKIMWYQLGPRVTPHYALLYKKRGINSTCHRGPYDAIDKPILSELIAAATSTIKTATTTTTTLSDPLRPLQPVGRLDLESEGLMLLSNDGTFSRLCTSPAIGVTKLYRVLVISKKGNSTTTTTSSKQTCPINNLLQEKLYYITNNVQFHNNDKHVGEATMTTTTQQQQQEKDKSMTTMTMKPKSKIVHQHGFLAKSCTIVDWQFVSYSDLYRYDSRISTNKEKNNNNYHHGEKYDNEKSINANKNDNITIENNNNKTNNDNDSKALVALIDVQMQEGAKREVRRLMKSIGFLTWMLVRTQIAGTIISCKSLNEINFSIPNENGTNNNYNDNNTEDITNFEYYVPKSVKDALQKVHCYQKIQLQQRQQQQQPLISGYMKNLFLSESIPFRYLETKEVNDIFSMIEKVNKANIEHE